jgi:hypothetical protein
MIASISCSLSSALRVMRLPDAFPDCGPRGRVAMIASGIFAELTPTGS